MCSPSGREGKAARRAAGLALAILLVPGLRAQGEDPELLLRIRKEELAYRLARTDAERDEVKAQLADALEGARDPALRARGLRLRLDLDPEDHRVKRELADVAVELGRTVVARRLYEEVISANPDDVLARLGVAYLYEDLRLYDQAALEYEGVLDRDGENRDALLGLAQALLSLNKAGRALPHLERLLDLDPTHAEARRLRAEAQREIADGLSTGGEGAEEEKTPAELAAELATRLREARERGEDGLAQRRQLAAALMRALRPGQARNHYLEILAAAPADSGALLGLSRAHRELGDHSGARLYAERAERLEPDSWLVALEIAEILVLEGRPDAARRQFDKAWRLDRTQVRTLLERGLFETEQKAWDAAAEWLMKAAAREPDNGTVFAALAQVRARSGDLEGARGALEQARRLDPRESLAWRVMAELAGEGGDADQAARAWREFLFFEPLSVEGWRALGEQRALMNDVAGAAQALDVALSLDPENTGVIEALEGVLARLPHDEASEDTRVLLKERLAKIAADNGDLETGIRLFETVAEERGRQLRRARSAAEEHEAVDDGRRRANLRRLLSLTRAKVRAHRRLAELYLEMERGDLVETQYKELHHLDPGAAKYVLDLAMLYYERADHHAAVAWFKHLPERTRLSYYEKVARAESLDATGRETQSEEAYREIERTEHRSDEVEEALADHASRRGNLFAAERHSRRAYTLFGGNQPSLQILRSLGMSETPDWWTEFFRFDDSDGIQIHQVLYGRRAALSPKTMLAAAASWFQVEDRFTPQQSDVGGQVMVRHELSERARVSGLIGFVRFGVGNDLAWDLQFDYNPDDRHNMRLRFFQDSINETPLASTRGFEQTGFELQWKWFAHHRWKLESWYESTNITGDNSKTAWNLDLALRPLGKKFPGWIHYARGKLDYRRQVAPALYFSPSDLSRSDLYLELLQGVGSKLFVRGVYGLHRDGDLGLLGEFGRTHHATLSVLAEVGPKGRLNLDYTNLNRSRSYHDFSRGQTIDELTLSYNAEF